MNTTATIEYRYNYCYRHTHGIIDRSAEYYEDEGVFDNDNFTPLRIAVGIVTVPIAELKEFVAKYEKEN